ncbi:hypothetical protein DTL21_06000 [Bremerella cremea]|uniref:Uncharacterized protein n=1 Tax=Blastopirellula marina TaxID=124 RepID=A0A2S8G031_9BACT|nr:MULTISPECIES: hypothetical protein [Pirellulaceae]PQO37494.1 hypothetical protein C5Y83_06000 [Blastopirellula marina]RCS49881.1 hypothetical protein DTL21_06000 [Bremerella cremea]
MNKDGRWNGLLGLIVVLVACGHLSQMTRFNILWGFSEPIYILFLQACLAGMWIVGGAARWWIRAGLLLVLAPYLYWVSNVFYGSDEVFYFVSLLLANTIFSIWCIRHLCGWWLGKPFAFPQFSILQMMLLVSFCFAGCVVWGSVLIRIWQRVFEGDFDLPILIMLAIFTGVVILTALPALFASRVTRWRISWVAWGIVIMIPWGILALAMSLSEPISPEAVIMVNLQVWIVALATAASIYPLQAIRRPNGEPYCRIFQPIDRRPEEFGEESTLEKSESQVAVSDHDRVTTDVP